MGNSESNEAGKRIGIIGLGSIGVKHCEALSEIGVKNIQALRTGKGMKTIPETLLKIVENIESFEQFNNIDAFIVSNPTALHLDVIKHILKYHKPIFIEKPLTDENLNSNEIIQDLLNYKYKIQVGFCLRFHNVVLKVNEIIKSGLLGKIYFADLKVGQFLPQWHPYTDYRNEYFSKKNLGGGAIRTLSHEIDLAQFFFGNPIAIKSFQAKVSDLEIDVDDLSIIFLKYSDKTVKLEIDFLQKNPKRIGVIHGSENDLEYDIFNNTVSLYNKDGFLLSIENIEKNNMYTAQMNCFLKETMDGFSTVEESLAQMQIIENVENYNKNNGWLSL